MKKDDLPNYIKGETKYEKLNNTIDVLSSSEYIDSIKKDKIEVMNKNFQVEYIDSKLDNLNIKTLENMPSFETKLELEIREALEQEIDKIPETIKDDIYKLEEGINQKYEKVNNMDFFKEAVDFANDYNSILNSQLEYLEVSDISEKAIETYNKNETILLISDRISISNGTIEYKDFFISEDDFTIDQGLDKIDTMVEATRKLFDDGVKIEDYSYIKEGIYETLYAMSALSLSNDDLDIEKSSEILMDFIEDRNNYIKETIPEIDLDLKEVVEEIEQSLNVELDASIEKEDLTMDLDDDLVIEEDGFDLEL